MEENTKIRLNLSGLKKKSSEAYEAENTGLDSKIPAQSITKKAIKFELTQDISPPHRVAKVEKVSQETLDTHMGVANNRETPVQEVPESSEVRKGKKLSFSAITGITQEQEKENSKNKKDEEHARAETQLATDKKREENTIEHKKEEVKFTNYRSAFKNESENLIKKIQKFRYTPKTRVGFLASLIVLTGFSIGLLMVFFPEKHSPEIYKASLFEIYNSERKSHSETELAQDTWKEEIDELGDEEDISTDDEDIIEDNTQEQEREISKVEREMTQVRNHLINRYK